MKLIVNDKYKIAYLPIPKNACSSMKKLFLILSGDTEKFSSERDELDHIHRCKILNTVYIDTFFTNTKYSTYKSIIVVRNPYSRLVSAFLDKFVNTYKCFDRKYWINTPWERVSNLISKDRRKIGISFEDFVKFVDPHSKNCLKNEIHWKKQSEIAKLYRYRYTYTVKFENLNSELNKIFIENGIPMQMLDNLKKSRSFSHYTNSIIDEPYKILNTENKLFPNLWTSYYCKSLMDLVYQKYKMDFILLGYSKEIKNVLK